MKTILTLKELTPSVDRWRCNKKKIGFIPTMGALHEGHLSLIRAAKKECDKVIVSIFVNPKQFGPNEDYASYPGDLKKDSRILTNENVDLLVAPTIEEMYPQEFATEVRVSEKLTQPLCGVTRPDHFNGVATVVTKFLNAVRAHRAYFGQKDYQQSVVIKQVVADLNIGTDIVICPIIREHDGLAKSSRNVYLSESERLAAPTIYQALKLAEGMLQVGERNPQDLIDAVRKCLTNETLFEIDYIAAKNAETLEDLKILDGKIVVAIAVKLSRTRLIDNIVIEDSSGS